MAVTVQQKEIDTAKFKAGTSLKKQKRARLFITAKSVA